MPQPIASEPTWSGSFTSIWQQSRPTNARSKWSSQLVTPIPGTCWDSKPIDNTDIKPGHGVAWANYVVSQDDRVLSRKFPWLKARVTRSPGSSDNRKNTNWKASAGAQGKHSRVTRVTLCITWAEQKMSLLCELCDRLSGFLNVIYCHLSIYIARLSALSYKWV